MDGVAGLIGQQAVGRQLVVPVFQDALLARAGQDEGGVAAAEALAQATSLEPERAAWWFEYAESLLWSQQFTKAEEAWNEVIRLLPPLIMTNRQADMIVAQVSDLIRDFLTG